MNDEAPLPTPDAAVSAQFRKLSRWHAGEYVFWIAIAASYFVFPDHRMLLNAMAIAGLFAVSLDLILGYAGILSLGHAALFGMGAYCAGIITTFGVTDPLLGLLIAAAASGFLGLLTSFLVLRGSDLTRLMVTLGVVLVLHAIANQLGWLTGGADGLEGVTVGPLLGVFSFDLYGNTACAYSLCVLFLLFLVARVIVHSPFGWSLGAIKGNSLRAGLVGIRVTVRLVAIYTLAATYAGVAGALLTQTTQFVSLDVLTLERSANILLMLMIGGVGYLYGGIIGAAIFTLMQDRLSAITPQYWTFWIGLLLVLLVLVGRERLTGLPAGCRGLVRLLARAVSTRAASRAVSR
ncbi:MAG: branched-chain amino acid ABC transporter permease [Stellaceae bacterium]